MLESEDNARDASEHSQAHVKSIQSFEAIVISHILILSARIIEIPDDPSRCLLLCY